MSKSALLTWARVLCDHSVWPRSPAGRVQRSASFKPYHALKNVLENNLEAATEGAIAQLRIMVSVCGQKKTWNTFCELLICSIRRPIQAAAGGVTYRTERFQWRNLKDAAKTGMWGFRKIDKTVRKSSGKLRDLIGAKRSQFEQVGTLDAQKATSFSLSTGFLLLGNRAHWAAIINSCWILALFMSRPHIDDAKMMTEEWFSTQRDPQTLPEDTSSHPLPSNQLQTMLLMILAFCTPPLLCPLGTHQ